MAAVAVVVGSMDGICSSNRSDWPSSETPTAATDPLRLTLPVRLELATTPSGISSVPSTSWYTELPSPPLFQGAVMPSGLSWRPETTFACDDIAGGEEDDGVGENSNVHVVGRLEDPVGKPERLSSH